MVESQLNIFHSKFNLLIFCNTDLWISCLKIKQILQIILTIASCNITPSLFLLGEYKTNNFIVDYDLQDGHVEAAAQLLGPLPLCAASGGLLRPTAAWPLLPGAASSSP